MNCLSLWRRRPPASNAGFYPEGGVAGGVVPPRVEWGVPETLGALARGKAFPLSFGGFTPPKACFGIHARKQPLYPIGRVAVRRLQAAVAQRINAFMIPSLAASIVGETMDVLSAMTVSAATPIITPAHTRYDGTSKNLAIGRKCKPTTSEMAGIQ